MSLNITPEPTEDGTAQIDQIKLNQLIQAKMSEQSMPFALLAGLLSSLVAAAIWATITYITSFQIGFMAIGVGFLVGYAVKYFGNGMTTAYGVVGAAFALFGCVFGNLLTSIIAISFSEDASVLFVVAAFASSPTLVAEVMKETFSPIDLIFYAIAVYQGYKLSFAGFTEAELASIQQQS